MTDFIARPLVYIAGPYSHPDPVQNTRLAIEAAEMLLASGLVTPVIPHLSLLWHLIASHDVEFWYAYDLVILSRCDALLRLVGESTGADGEVEFAVERQIPIWHEPGMLLDWAATYCAEIMA